MSRYTCWKCGCGFDGTSCPVCAVNEQAEDNARRATRDQEEATAAMKAAISEQTAQLAEEMSRTREAAEAVAFENQMAIAEAAEKQQRALAKAAEEHRQTTANAWKLQAQAKSDQAYRLYKSGLLSEALNLAIQAIREDPANIDGVFVAGACLESQGKVEESHAYLAKQVQMLSMPDYRMQMKTYLQVLHAIGSDSILTKLFCKILRDHLPLWPACERIETAEKFIDTLLAIEEYQLAVMVQRWVLQSKGLTLETLASTRRLFNTIASSQNAIDASRAELQKIIQWIESPSNSASEYSLRSKTGQTALFTIASSLELSSYLHSQSGLLVTYFKDLPFEKRAGFEAELSQLKQLVTGGQISQNAFSTILDVAKEKYASWQPYIEEQVRTTAATQLQNLPKQGSGCLLTIMWFVILLALGQVGFFLVTRSFIQPGGPLYAIYDFGALLGGILLASLTVHVRRAFHKYRSAHQLMAGASNQQNTTLEQLGLPQISAQEPTLRSPAIDLMVCLAVAGAFLIGWQILLSRSTSPSSSVTSSENSLYNGTGVEDGMSGQSAGQPVGIQWTQALGSRGALFRASDSSRIEYPSQIPSEGTLEFWIKVESGYEYANYVFKPHLSCALVFSSDVQGGDVTWPGDLKLTLCKNGNIELWMATSAYNRPPAVATVARATSFRFGEWHAVGVSYGSMGQYIMVDGTVVESAPGRTQRLGGGGTHQGPADVPTIGETVSHTWQPHQYNGGFEGIVARFRASINQQDWRVAKGIDEPTATPGAVSETTAPVGMQPAAEAGNQELTPAPANQNTSATQIAAQSLTRPKVSAGEMSALKTFGVVPSYPPIARAARIQGTVLLDAIIADDGSVKTLAVVSGPAALQQSALDAVKTWRYKPYVVNGVSTEVETNIEVVFKLGD